MALSAKARKRLEVAMARRQEALEVIAAIDSNGSGPACRGMVKYYSEERRGSVPGGGRWQR